MKREKEREIAEMVRKEREIEIKRRNEDREK
jgi:hypothetical protein